MEEKELKHVIALLLEDAKRRQELEPNAGTEARIQIARLMLDSGAPSIFREECPLTMPNKQIYLLTRLEAQFVIGVIIHLEYSQAKGD
ncbi:hypothetical protein [Lelliottia nimipressuralis]|uniref:Uncharacterized protein n=1 Tax=Lelliottia nimipressuralis TaxID=69220 RepID=A0ABY3P6L6_9ENTR|nr:hypothetical protein [Lelliottia nimipressuralis]RXJ10463.1 hypothetical protein ETG88_20090 [Lelliottia nimipressuralis]TYT34968.1 hypothetical protein FZO59_04860 [Lelliottia nimipressuralis]